MEAEPTETHQSCMSCCLELQLKDPLLTWLSWSKKLWSAVFIGKKEAIPFPSSSSISCNVLFSMLSEVSHNFAILLHQSTYRDLKVKRCKHYTEAQSLQILHQPISDLLKTTPVYSQGEEPKKRTVFHEAHFLNSNSTARHLPFNTHEICSQ